MLNQLRNGDERNKMKKRKPVTPDDKKTALQDVGVRKGQAVMVHTSLRSLGYVCGGEQSCGRSLSLL